MRKHASWESICERCGRCCFEKVEFENKIYYTDEPCAHLDPESRLCRIYDRRHLDKPDCSPLTPEVLKMGVLPADCPYVRDLDNYPAPEMCEDEDGD